MRIDYMSFVCWNKQLIIRLLILKLIYNYGGINFPSYFVALKPITLLVKTEDYYSYSNTIFGGKKKSKLLKDYIIEYELSISGFFQSYHTDYTVSTGTLIGLYSDSYKPMTLETLFSKQVTHLHDDSIGILIPHHQLYKRTFYNWFIYLSFDEIIEVQNCLVYYLTLGIS